MVWSLPAAPATTYQIQSRTAARSTQYLRADRSFSAPRVFSQSLTLSAYNLRDNEAADLDARVRLRFVTDLGLAERLRQDPLFDARFNDLRLDLAYLRWRPLPSLQLQAGRQWHPSALGIVDFDGLALRWAPEGEGWQPLGAVAAGRQVQRGLTTWDPGAWDVQGLPPNQTALTDDPRHLMAAATAGAQKGAQHRLELAAQHHRRPTDSAGQWASTQRLGATALATPTDGLRLTSALSYHSQVGTMDRLRLGAGLTLLGGRLSVGVDQRRPVFDAASIFNLFGAQPHRSAYTAYRRPVALLAGALELRTWSRMYFDRAPPLLSLGDARAVGAALAGHHRWRGMLPLQMSWQLSAQTRTGQRGGDQYLADLRLRAAAPIDGLYVTGRLLGLWAQPVHHRRQPGHATTAGLGAQWRLGDLGRFGLRVESRLGSLMPANTALFAQFELEATR